ncbi:hypothetical protein CKM354_001165000 [Cercospora kikuchii]|uniref:Heterokaryon incompatibility domain-containing protein n=1 Tax=Cercospora kikuchii TaxID=84275 RepID=A0A9P3CSN2_9PEZI|nr:uncharacterized protein CKM354_001165000 [Cercospora kikuchii]GIZ48597.1 hypothetical protein CKM354_001165000 [Cercospora kikuchii]
MDIDNQDGREETDEGSPTFEYTPFASSSQAFRLLRFAPGSSSTSPISLLMGKWSQNKAPSYAALSYTWGPPEPRSNILVNGRRMKVREHCLLALRQLRSMLQPSAWFWIDAICINQEDVDEKSSQVQFMGEIYKNADEVLVSVGDHDDASKILLGLLLELESEMLQEHQRRSAGRPKSPIFGDRMLSSAARPGSGDVDAPPWFRWYQQLPFEKASEVLEVLERFAKRPYWRRLWILQETMLATKIRLLCGFTVVSWKTLSLFCDDIFSSLSGSDFPNARKHIFEPLKVIGFVNVVQKTDPSKVIGRAERASEKYEELKRDLRRSHMRTLLLNRNKGPWTPKAAHLPHILKDNRERLCSDSRDRIYGFLHLVNGTPEMEVDYRLSPVRVGIEAVKYFQPQKNLARAKRSPLHFDYRTDFLLGDYITLLQQEVGIDRQSQDFMRIAMSRLGLGGQRHLTAPPSANVSLPYGWSVYHSEFSDLKKWHPHDRPQKKVVDPNFLAEKCSVITRNDNGNLSVPITVFSKDWSNLMQVMTAYDEQKVNQAVAKCISSAQELWPKMPPLPLHGTLLSKGNCRRQGVIVGLCSGNTLDGDVLARPVNKNDMLHALILRPGIRTTLQGFQETLYEIVGQAILMRGCQSDDDTSTSLWAPAKCTNLWPHVAFTVIWGIEDAFLFYSNEADELKQAVVHDEDAGFTWHMENNEYRAAKPAVPVDFVESSMRLVTNVTSHRYSSYAIVNNALRRATDQAARDAEDTYDGGSENGSDEFDPVLQEMDRLHDIIRSRKAADVESDDEIEEIACALNDIVDMHGGACRS